MIAAGPVGEAARSRPLVAAVQLKDGSDLWREDLPAPVVRNGAAIDHAGRVFVALDDGRLECFAPAKQGSARDWGLGIRG